jgi:catechol-2,3-dioxygenase
MPMSTGPKLAHIVLQTNRLTDMRDWYCALLSARVVYENPAVCFLTFDAEHHRVAFVSPPGPRLAERSPLTVGLQHSAYTFDTLLELLERYEALKAGGLEPFVPIQHGVTTSLYYRDPDGNLAELQVDTFATPEAATNYMMTAQEYAEDTIGPSFDPQLMLDELRAGRSEDELMTRAWALSQPQLPHPVWAFAGEARN